MTRFAGLILLAAVAGCDRADRLNGGGSSFVYPIMLKWSRVYAAERGVQIDYQSTGSGNGIQQMSVGTIDFGATDAPINAEQMSKAVELGGPVVHIPLVMGGVVPVYNLPGLQPGQRLRFSGPVLAGILLGSVQQWDDPSLRELNPGVELPAQRILVVGRSDPSGTTAIMADYVATVAQPAWVDKGMGKPGTATRWPTGEAQKGNEGVAGLVRRVPGSFGYVELKYAEEVGLEFGAVRNRAGRFVVASPSSVRAAAAARLSNDIPPELYFSLIDAPGDDSYPISGTVWAVFFERQPPGRSRELTAFLSWATNSAGGQRYAEQLRYAPLPANLVVAVQSRLAAIAAGAGP